MSERARFFAFYENIKTMTQHLFSYCSLLLEIVFGV